MCHEQVLAVTKPLSVHLQKTVIDVMKAMSLVDEIIACLDEMRSSDGSFAIVWKMAESLAETVESDLKQPRLVAKLGHHQTRNTSNEVFSIHFWIMFCQSCALASAFIIGL